MEKSDILRRFFELTEEKNRMRANLLRAVSEHMEPSFKELERECSITGHSWKSDLNGWRLTCEWCRAFERVDK
jgi:hypothetical protein